MNGQLVALILAIVSLVIWAVRRPNLPSGSQSRAPIWLAPVAIIIGVLPGVLGLSGAMRRAGSVASIVLSLTAIGLLLMRARRARSSR
jgi:hypothetical protein